MINETALVLELEERYGPVKRTNSGWIRIKCPTCNDHDARKYKRYIKADSYTSGCFICGVKKDVRDLVEGRVILQQDPNKPVIQIVKKVDPRAFEIPYYKSIPVNKLELDHPAYRFLTKDYLYDMDSYAEKGIVYVPSDGGRVFKSFPPYTTSAQRLIFPVNENGKMVGWQMRSIPGTFYGDRKDVIRYYHLFDKGNHVYNYEEAKKNNPEEVIVVEGVKKALKFPNGVATWGAGISHTQTQIIKSWPRVVIMLDAKDHSGTIQIRAQELVDRLRAEEKVAINVDLGKYDVESPDDLPAETLKQIIEEEWYENGGRR